MDEKELVEYIETVFVYRKPFGSQSQRYQDLRNKAKELAELIGKLCPPSTERGTAFNKLRETIMWANSSIACNEKEEVSS